MVSGLKAESPQCLVRTGVLPHQLVPFRPEYDPGKWELIKLETLIGDHELTLEEWKVVK